MRRLCSAWILTFILATGVQAGDQSPLPRHSVAESDLPLAGHIYVIDPGHGGDDNGTTRTGLGRSWKEKQFTLGLAVELIAQIEDLGGTVVSTVRIPKDLEYAPFGANRIPVQGAEHFNLLGSPKIRSGIPGLSHRLEIGRTVLNQYPTDQVHWISIHFDFVRVSKDREPISGTRIIYPVVNESTGFVHDLAQAFLDAGWLRAPINRPVVASGRRGVKRLFILRGEADPKIETVTVGRRKKGNRYYNRVIDRVLIEYANFKSNEDWERLQQPDGSLRRLAAITVQGLVLHARRGAMQHPRGP